MWPNPQETPDLVTFTGEILNGKLRFLYNAIYNKNYGSTTRMETANVHHKSLIFIKVCAWRLNRQSFKYYNRITRVINLGYNF